VDEAGTTNPKDEVMNCDEEDEGKVAGGERARVEREVGGVICISSGDDVDDVGVAAEAFGWVVGEELGEAASEVAGLSLSSKPLTYS